MSSRNWLPNAPLGAGLIVVLALGVTALSNHQRKAEHAYQAARQEYEQSKRVVTAEAAAHREHTDDKAYREEWRSEQDLEAQRVMAWWSKIASIATCIGVVLLVATLWETTRTTAAALVAAKQGQRSADIAERALILSERPWLTVGAAPAPGGEIIDDRFHPAIIIRARNFGKTPAIQVVSDEIVRSAYGAIQIKSLAETLAGTLMQSLDIGIFDSVIVPGEEFCGLVSKSLTLDEARGRYGKDGTAKASALIVMGVAYRSTMDATPRYSIRSYIYTWQKLADPNAPNGGISVSITEFPGGSLMS